MEIITVDKLGRVLLPKALRDGMGLKAGSRLMAVPAGSKLVLQEIDVATLLRQIAEDLKGVDFDGIQREVAAEAEVEARAYLERVLPGYQRLRGRDLPAAAKDGKPRAVRRRARR